MFRKFYSLLLASAVSTVAMVGCNLSEDLSDCGVLRINMRYTLNNERTDQLADLVGDVRIYVFEESTGLLVDIIEPTSEDITRGYMEIQNPRVGEFTFSAWAGSGNDIEGSGFMEIEMDNAATHSYRDLWDDDETHIDDFYVMVEHDELPSSKFGDVLPRRTEFVDLFHSSIESFEVTREKEQSIDLYFVRDTNILDITINGIEHLPSAGTRAGEEPVGLFLTGRNGRYTWDNTIDEHARLVRYESTTRSLDETTMQSDIKTMHINQVRHKEDPLLLYITDPATGKDLHAPINIIQAIGQVRDEDGNYMYRTQEDIDREYVFPIEITISAGLRIKVTINDWVVEFPDAEIM